MIVGGRHVGIPVFDMEKAKGFYIGLLGFTIRSDEIEEGPFLSTIIGFPEAKAHIIKATCTGGWMVELLHYHNPHNTSKGQESKLQDVANLHIALTVDDIDAEFRRLREAGVAFISEPTISPNGYAKVAFCQDPDGNYIELVEVLAEK